MNAPPNQQEVLSKGRLLYALKVVLGVGIILAFLAAILFPVMTRNPSRSPRAHALSNIKQASTALLIYAGDNDERYPAADRWMDSLKEYVKNDNIFRSSFATPNDPTDYGFAFRREYSLKRVTDFDDPKRYVTLFDSTILSRNANSGLETLPKPGRYTGASEPGNLYGFADSHVKFINDVDLYAPGPDGKPRIR